MSRLEPRVKRLEAKMYISERRVKVGEFGYGNNQPLGRTENHANKGPDAITANISNNYL